MVVGAINGRIDLVFEKLVKLQTKNAFSFVIIVGDLFADPLTASSEDGTIVSSILEGKLSVPLPTYFTVGNHAFPQRVQEHLEQNHGELCTNLFYLGKRSTTKTSEGIRIVTLGGSLDPNVTAGLSKDKYLPFHTEGDVKSLHGANTADILITTDWPTMVREGSKISLPDHSKEPLAEPYISHLCATLKPRYHFSVSPHFFYEREPFFHQPSGDQMDIKPVTRFISLASFDNPTKQKWLYAFSLDPKASPSLTLPNGTTASPFVQNSKKRRLPTQDDSYSRFSHNDGYQRHSKRPRQPPPSPSECFFCLSNPNIATHLITSIATDTYLTTAKGPLSTDSTFPALNCPAHVLIIPLSHSPTFESMEIGTRENTYKEMQRYRSALQSMVARESKLDLGAVTWEVSRSGGIHVHWQFLPVPSHLIKKGFVEAAFNVEAENEKYPPFKTKDIGDGSKEKSDYFRVWIWEAQGTESNEAMKDIEPGDKDSFLKPAMKETSLVLPITANFRFDLQFGRRVMAKLLQLPGRFDWKACTQTQIAESNDSETFKKLFKKYDFSLEE